MKILQNANDVANIANHAKRSDECLCILTDNEVKTLAAVQEFVQKAQKLHVEYCKAFQYEIEHELDSTQSNSILDQLTIERHAFISKLMPLNL